MLNTLNDVLNSIGIKKNDCHPELPMDSQFHGLGFAGGAISLEEAMFLVGLIAVEKPDVVIELGTSLGASTVILGAALKDLNEIGDKGDDPTFLFSVDHGPLAEKAHRLVVRSNLPVEFVIGAKSTDFLENLAIDPANKYFIFSDTDIPIRPVEVDIILRKFPRSTPIVVHDTSDLHPFGPMKLKEKLKEMGHSPDIFELPSPRGMSFLRS